MTSYEVNGKFPHRAFGDKGGAPLIALHGGADSSLIWELFDSAAKMAGVRLLAVDRPGFGNKPYKGGRSVLDHGDDLVRFADHLEIEKFPLISISGGLVHALGAAWKHPERVTRLTSYSGMFLGAPDALPEMSVAQRITVKLGMRSPRALTWLGVLLFGPQVIAAKRRPELIVKLLRSSRPSEDRAALDMPHVKTLMTNIAPEALRSVSAVNEALGTQQLPPYPFDLDEIKQRVEIWQGGRDTVHTPAMGQHLATNLPNATLHLQPELATFDMMHLYEEMLTLAVS